MTKLLPNASPIFAAAAAVLATACAAGPTLEPLDEQTSAYGSFLAARYAGINRDAQAAASYFEDALESDPNNVFLVERAFTSALASGDMDTAVELAEQAIEFEPADRLARILLASRDVRNGRYQRAREHLEGHDLGAFNRVVGAVVLAWAQAGDGDTDAALETLDAPADAPILGHLMTLHRALILDRAGRADEAEELYDQAMSTGLLRAVVVDAYGRRLERSGRREDASELYVAQLSENPDDPIALSGLSRIERGVRPQAFAGSAAQGASVAVFGPAATLIGNTQSDLATVYLRLSLYLDPENSTARYLLGDLLARAGLDEEAFAVLSEAAPGASYYVASRAAAAWSLMRLDQRDAGLQMLEDLAEETDDRSARISLADAHRALEDYASASVIYDRLIADGETAGAEGDWRLLYARGVSYERLGRWPEAEADFHAALALEPDQPSVLNYLGYTWVDRGENLEEAFDMIRRAVELEPGAGYIVDSLGWAHYKLGEYDEAVTYLERAVELDPQDPTINDHLGDVYWRAGRRLEASYQWTRALSLDPSDEQRADINAKLADGLAQEETPVYASP